MGKLLLKNIYAVLTVVFLSLSLIGGLFLVEREQDVRDQATGCPWYAPSNQCPSDWYFNEGDCVPADDPEHDNKNCCCTEQPYTPPDDTVTGQLICQRTSNTSISIINQTGQDIAYEVVEFRGCPHTSSDCVGDQYKTKYVQTGVGPGQTKTESMSPAHCETVQLDIRSLNGSFPCKTPDGHDWDGGVAFAIDSHYDQTCEIADAPTPTPTNTVPPPPNSTATPTPTRTPTPTNTVPPPPNSTATPTPTLTPTPLSGTRNCDQACNTENWPCVAPLTCVRIDYVSHCRHPDCIYDSDCVCTVPSSTPTSTLTPTATVPPPPGSTNTPTPTFTPTPPPGSTNTPTPTFTPTPPPGSTSTPTPPPGSTSTPVLAQADPVASPTRIILPSAGIDLPSRILTILGSIVILVGLLVLL